MQSADLAADILEPLCGGLDQEQQLFLVADLSLPPVHRAHTRQDIDAGSEPRHDERIGNLPPQPYRVDRSQYDYLVHNFRCNLECLEYDLLSSEMSTRPIARNSMRRQKVSCCKEAYYILSIVGAILAAAITVWGPHGYMDLKKAQVELQVQKEKVSDLKRTNGEAIARIQALKSDKPTLERVARERGYAGADEIIQILPPEPQPQKQK